MIPFLIDHPYIPFGIGALIILGLLIQALKWGEGPSPDYDDSENGVGRPL